MPITIGSFNNVPAPGDPITSPWAQEISQYVTDRVPRFARFGLGADLNCPAGQSTTGPTGTTPTIPAGALVLVHFAASTNQVTPGSFDFRFSVTGVGNTVVQGTSGTPPSNRAESFMRSFVQGAAGALTVTISLNVWGSQPVTFKSDSSIVVEWIGSVSVPTLLPADELEPEPR